MKYRRTLILSSILFSLLVPARLERVSAALPQELSAQIESVRREREVLLSEQKRLQAELEAVNRESQTLGTAVKSLDATRKKLAADIRLTQSKISSTDLNIKTLETTMADKERQIGAHHAAIALALQTLHERDSKPFILDVLATGKLSDVWQDNGQLASLNETLKSEVGNLREIRQTLEIQKALKERDKKKIASLHAELTGQKSIVEESKLAQEKLLAQTKSKEAAYQQMLADNIARQKQFEADLFRLESELKVNLDPTLVPAAQANILAWPLDNVYITQRFGRTSGSTRLYASGTHNGVDFRASQGTPVKAMLGGVVEGTGNTDEQRGCGSYGRWILIKHGNGLTSVYGHLSASVVQNGQAISTGEVIGYSGGSPGVFGSGYSTGPHLHVGLFASQGVSIRQFVTSRGCQQVFVPIADVRAYLDPLAYLPAL
jgi:murein DD-endopeptidase MepM/ murein hydrolase activator NlpD